jgi:mono/diheme cytochrome c family protein
LYGCFACHQVPGFDQAPRIAPELNGFGDKAPSLLSFGDTVTNHADQTWERWTQIKLASPRAFRTERENLVMPDNGLDPDRARALMVVLKSLRADRFSDRSRRALSDREAMSEAGERLFQEYNCLGCHVENGRGGQARRLFADPGLYPPDLSGEGAKVQPAWLFQFLKKPAALRPWLTMRMPEFGLGDQAGEALVYYLMTRSKQTDLLLEVPAEMDPDRYAETEDVFVKLQCLSCHQLALGQNQKLSDLAPDMGLTRYRLRPEWMLEFIIDPQRLMPGTKMPNFFPLEDDEDPESLMTPFPEWMGGDARAQVRAVRDYLYVMKQSADPVAVP